MFLGRDKEYEFEGRTYNCSKTSVQYRRQIYLKKE